MKRKSPLRVEFAAFLLDNLIEKAAGVLGLDLLPDPPVGGEVRDVACAAGEDSDDATVPGEDDGLGSRQHRKKLAMCPVIGQDSDLEGGATDAVVTVDTGEGLETVGTTDGGGVANPFFTTGKRFSPSISRCWGLRISSFWTTP